MSWGVLIGGFTRRHSYDRLNGFKEVVRAAALFGEQADARSSLLIGFFPARPLMYGQLFLLLQDANLNSVE